MITVIHDMMIGLHTSTKATTVTSSQNKWLAISLQTRTKLATRRLQEVSWSHIFTTPSTLRTTGRTEAAITGSLRWYVWESRKLNKSSEPNWRKS